MARPKQEPIPHRRPMLADKCPDCGAVKTLTAKGLGALYTLTGQYYASHAAACRARKAA